jgi:muconolactone delta-isomerase
MNRILVTTYLSKDERIAGVMEAEYAMTNSWKAQGIIEHLFARENNGGGVVVFNGTELEKVKQLMSELPLFPYFERVDYMLLEKVY